MNEQNMYESPEPPRMKRRKQSSCISRLAKLALVVIFVWWFNNFTLKTTEETITSDKVKNDIKIAVISDYHAYDSVFSIKGNTIIKKICKIDPDFVCALGDMHSDNATEKEKEMSMSLMTGIINEGYDLYFVLGEHDDRTNAYVSEMKKNKIKVLDQESVKIRVNESNLALYGISNAYFSPEFDLRNEFHLNKGEYNILLAHIPMYEEYEKFGTDLTLCGDTHGGVVRFPFIGPAYLNGQILPELSAQGDGIYDKGLFKYDGGYMFITSGIGNYINNANIPIRFCNRPEVAVITISPQK